MANCITTLLFWPIILIWGLFQTSLQVSSKCHCYLRVSLFWRFTVINVLNRFLQRYKIDIDVYFKDYPLQYFYFCPWLFDIFLHLTLHFSRTKALLKVWHGIAVMNLMLLLNSPFHSCQNNHSSHFQIGYLKQAQY